MIHRVLIAVLVWSTGAACAAAGAPTLDPGTRRAAFALEFSTLETDVEGAGSLDSDTIELEGDIGWFVAPRVEVGANAQYMDNEIDDGTDDLETTSLGLGPFVRYYFPSSGGTIPFVDARIAYADAEAKLNGASVDGDGVQWAGGFGVLAPFSSSVALEALVRYVGNSLEIEGQDFDTDGFQLMLGLAVFF